MKRIIFAVTSDLSYDQRMNRICSTLAENGYDVLLVGRVKRNSIPLKDELYSQKRLKCFFEKGFLFYIEYNIRLFLFLLFRKTDIISAADIDTALPSLLISKLKGKKIVLDAHEYFTEVIEVVHRPFVKKIWSVIEGYVIRRVKYCYTVSEGLKMLFLQKYGVGFEVIRNVPYIREFQEENTGDKYIIYAGAVNAGRGLEELLEVIPEINIRLEICGDGDILQKLKDEVKTHNLDNKVHFTGYLPPEELRKRIRGAYIGVLLLRNESLSYYYSLANKFFDYIHAEVPQLTISFPEYKRLNEQYEVAYLCNLDKEQIKNGLIRLLEDQVYYEKLKANCLAAAKELNWQSESKKLIDLYKRVVDGE